MVYSNAVICFNRGVPNTYSKKKIDEVNIKKLQHKRHKTDILYVFDRFKYMKQCFKTLEFMQLACNRRLKICMYYKQNRFSVYFVFSLSVFNLNQWPSQNACCYNEACFTNSATGKFRFVTQDDEDSEDGRGLSGTQI